MDKMMLNYLQPLDSPNATKTFKKVEAGWELDSAYSGGKLYNGYSVPASSISDLHDALETSLDFPAFIICGAFKEGTEMKGMVRRKRENKDKLSPTIEDRELPFLPIDVDGWEYEEGMNPRHAVSLFIRKHLPKEFHKASYVYQLSASMGMKDDGVLKAHLFFWLKEPVHNLRMVAWAKAINEDKGWGNIIDPAIYTCSQPIYTQRRVCVGAPDPIESPLGFVKGDVDTLDWTPDMFFSDSSRTTGEGIGKGKHKKAEGVVGFDIANATRCIVSGENFHENVRGLAFSMANAKTPPHKIKAHIEGIMMASQDQDERWQARFDDIERLINTAYEQIEIPTYDDVLSWVQDNDELTVSKEFGPKIVGFTPVEIEFIKEVIQEKTGLKTKTINDTIKAAFAEDAEKKAQYARNRMSEERSAMGITEIDGELPENEIGDIIAEKVAASQKKPEVFMTAAGLARVIMSKPSTIRQLAKLDEQKEDYPKMPIINHFGSNYDVLRRRANKEVVIINNKGKELSIPRQILTTIESISHINWNQLSGIVEHPFVNDNWEVVQEDGYNKRTGLYAVLHHKLKLTPMEPKAAYNYLAYEVFDEFPFGSDLDRCAAVCALLTAIQRPSITDDNGFPGFAITSPIQSSGKTTLAQLISYAAFNRPIASTSWVDNEEEMGKQLLSILLEGQSCVLFDNIQAGSEIRSNELASAMTNDTYKKRLLGANETATVPTSTMWMFTGNNIQLTGDFATRVVNISIVPDTAKPESRVFSRDNIGQWALDNRKKILSAAISIIMAGKDIKDKSHAAESRFKLWEKFVRKPLLLVTGFDVLEIFASNRQSDPAALAKQNLFQQIFEEFKGEGATAKDILVAAGGGDAGAFNSSGTDLKDALVDVFGKYADNPRSIGRYLAGMDRQIFGDLQLFSDKRKPVIRWVVTKMVEKAV